MAKKADKGAEAEEGAKKKKPIKPIIVVVLALVGVKMFVLKEPEPTKAEIKAKEMAAEQELYNKCAEENGRETLGDLVTGGKTPNESSDSHTDDGGTDSHSDKTDSHGEGEEKASPRGRNTVVLAAATSLNASAGASAEGPIVANESSVTVNLYDGSYLKLGLAIQMAPGSDAKLVKDEGLLAKATDQTIGELAKHSRKELLQVKVRDSIKGELSFDLCRHSEAKILKIYFTEFVTQAPS